MKPSEYCSTQWTNRAFASTERAEALKSEKGGNTGGFDYALTESYLSMAKDTMMIRKKRAMKKKKMKM